MKPDACEWVVIRLGLLALGVGCLAYAISTSSQASDKRAREQNRERQAVEAKPVAREPAQGALRRNSNKVDQTKTGMRLNADKVSRQTADQPSTSEEGEGNEERPARREGVLQTAVPVTNTFRPSEGVRFANLSNDYQIDDGSLENAIGTGTAGAAIVWYVNYTLIPGFPTIQSVNPDAGFELGECNGLTVSVAVLDDPDGDGDPFDAEICGAIASAALVTTGDANPQKVALASSVNLNTCISNLSGSFFVAASVVQTAGCGFPAPADQTAPVPLTNWIGIGALTACPLAAGGGGAGCIVDCAAENCGPGLASNWILRANSDQPICGDAVCENAERCSCRPGQGICGGAMQPACDCPVPPANETPLVNCVDGLDNDCDGIADCDDSNCFDMGDLACEPCDITCAGGSLTEGGDCTSVGDPGCSNAAEPCVDPGDPDNYNGGCNSNGGFVWSDNLTIDGAKVCGVAGRYLENCVVNADCDDAGGEICVLPGTTTACGAALNCICRAPCPAGNADCDPMATTGGDAGVCMAGFCTGGLTAVRDTDWYIFNIPAGDAIPVRLCVTSEFEPLVGIVDDAGGANCAAAAFIEGGSAVGDDCTPVCVEVCLTQGTYSAFIAPSAGDTVVPCNMAQYTLTMDTGSILCEGSSLCLDLETTGLNCQPPDQEGHGAGGTVATTSTIGQLGTLGADLAVADTFQLVSGGNLNRVCWWGAYVDFGGTPTACASGSEPIDDFTITYYAMDTGVGGQAPRVLPGAVVGGPFNVGSVTRAPTGLTIGSGAGDLIEFSYNAVHGNVNTPANVCRWIEITNALTDADCTWLWETANPGDEVSAQTAGGAGGYIDGDQSDYDLAWCLGPPALLVNPAGCDLAGACCDDDAGSCDDDVTFNDCSAQAGRFGIGVTCTAQMPPCGGDACCHANGTCNDVTNPANCNAPGDQLRLNTFCRHTVCQVADSCDVDNGPGDPNGAAVASQLSNRDADILNLFVAEGADNFTFQGNAGNDCEINSIKWWVTHDPGVTPADYNGIQVVIYNDAETTGGPPPNVDFQNCNDVAIPQSTTLGAAFNCNTPSDCTGFPQAGCVDIDFDGMNDCVAVCTNTVTLPGNIINLNVETTIAHTWQGDLIAAWNYNNGTATPDDDVLFRFMHKPGDTGLHPGGFGADGYSADNFGDPLVAGGGAPLLTDDDAGPELNLYDGANGGIANYQGPAKADGGGDPAGGYGIMADLPRNAVWTLYVADAFGVSDSGSLDSWRLVFKNNTPKGPTGTPESVEAPIPCANHQECIDLGGTTCTGNECDDLTTLVPTGNHNGQVKTVYNASAPGGFSFIPYVKDGNPVSDSYEITIPIPNPPSFPTVEKGKKNWLALVPQLDFAAFGQSFWMGSEDFDGHPAHQIFEALGIFPWLLLDHDLAFQIAGQKVGQCNLADFADQNGDGIRDDNCVQWECVNDSCVSTNIKFSDVLTNASDCGADGVINVDDALAPLLCFANISTVNGAAPYACESINADVGGSFDECCPDGLCDLHDALKVIFPNNNSCSCPLDPGGLNFNCEPEPQPGAPGPGQNDARVFLAPMGCQALAPQTGTNSITIAPGATKTIGIWLQDDLAMNNSVSGFQLVLEDIVGGSGLNYGPTQAMRIDPANTDQIFPTPPFNAYRFAAFPPPQSFMGAVVLTNVTPPLPAVDPANPDPTALHYLAEFDITAAPGASGTFQIALNRTFQTPPLPISFFIGPGGSEYFVDEYQGLEVVVGANACCTIADCDDDNPCTFDQCTAGVCVYSNKTTGMTPIPPGSGRQADHGGFGGACPLDLTCDINDKFHAQNCFGNQNTMGMSPYPCESPGTTPNPVVNIDSVSLGGCCLVDKTCDINDAFSADNCFANRGPNGLAPYPCCCSFGAPVVCGGNDFCPPSPTPGTPAQPTPRSWTGMTLRGPRAVKPGDLVEIEVYLDGSFEQFRGYQLHLGASGGTTGWLELVDVSIDEDRANYIYGGLHGASWPVFNANMAQMMNGLDFETSTQPNAYLATFTYRVSPDASGTFVVEALYDPVTPNPKLRTFLFHTTGDLIGLDSIKPARITVAGRTLREARFLDQMTFATGC